MNLTIFTLALFWAYTYNSYFGWNWSSKSGEEIICDGIFAILMAFSVGFKEGN